MLISQIGSIAAIRMLNGTICEYRLGWDTDTEDDYSWYRAPNVIINSDLSIAYRLYSTEHQVCQIITMSIVEQRVKAKPYLVVGVEKNYPNGISYIHQTVANW